MNFAVALLSVGNEYADANDRPTRWRRAVTLAHSLCLDADASSREAGRVAKPRPQEERHVFYHAEHQFRCRGRHTKCLNDERGHSVGYPVIAIGGIDGGYGCGYPRLSC